MKNYIFIYYTIFLILFNHISAFNDLDKDPLPYYVSSVISKTSVLVTYKLDSGWEKNSAFLFGKYLFITKPNYKNNEIREFKEIQKFDFDDNKLNLKPFPDHLFSFGEKPNENHDLYVTLIKEAPFQLEQHPNYSEYFDSILSKDNFNSSLKDDRNEYYFIYFNQKTNKIFWEKYSSIDIESSIVPFSLSNSTDNLLDNLSSLAGGSIEGDIYLNLPYFDIRGILVLCKQENHCYITMLDVTINSNVRVYFINNKLTPYKSLLISKRFKID